MVKKKFILLMVFISLFISACGMSQEEASERIERHTSVKIPNDSKLEYNYLDNVFANGRLPQYSVYSFEDKPEFFLEENGFHTYKNVEFEGYFIDAMDGFSRIEQENIKFQPNWNEEYMWLEINWVYFAYFEDSMYLKIMMKVF